MSDPAFTCHFLDEAVYRAAEEERMALGRKRGEDPAWLASTGSAYGWASLHEVVRPCAMWYSTYLYDANDPEHVVRQTNAQAAIEDGTYASKNFYLSRFYWERWSAVRPPISVLCPNGREWCVDAKSSNGEGWQVEGEVPTITCTPSILVPGYHGYLKGGVFTPNM